MSDSIAPPSAPAEHTGEAPTVDKPMSSPVDKGKSKAEDVSMDEDDDDEEDDDDDMEEEEDDDMLDEPDAVDPATILPPGTRRARAPIDYSSAEAHAKAGITPGTAVDEDDD